MGLSHWAGRVATVPGLKLVFRGVLYEPAAVMIPSKRAHCGCVSDPAGERGGRVEGTVGARGPAEPPHRGLATSLKQHYNQLDPNERGAGLVTCCRLVVQRVLSWSRHQ